MASRVSKSETFRNSYGPWALVTGASEGIGLATAKALAAHGLNVVLVARRAELLQRLATELITEFSIAVRVIPADLSRPGDVDEVCNRTLDLDIGLLVAAAGFGTAGRFVESTEADELTMLDVNCRAVLVMTRTFARRFAERRRGGIILFSSIVAFQGVPNAAHYAATKAYNQTLAEGLRRELLPLGVDVLSCAPGPVRTGFAMRSNLRQSGGVDAAVVARETLAALGRRTTVRRGLLSKVLIGSLALLPRFGRTSIMGSIMAGMTKHRYEPKP